MLSEASAAKGLCLDLSPEFVSIASSLLLTPQTSNLGELFLGERLSLMNSVRLDSSGSYPLFVLLAGEVGVNSKWVEDPSSGDSAEVFWVSSDVIIALPASRKEVFISWVTSSCEIICSMASERISEASTGSGGETARGSLSTEKGPKGSSGISAKVASTNLDSSFDPSIVKPGVAVPGVPSTEAMSF